MLLLSVKKYLKFENEFKKFETKVVMESLQEKTEKMHSFDRANGLSHVILQKVILTYTTHCYKIRDEINFL